MIVLLMSCLVQNTKKEEAESQDTGTTDTQIEDSAEPQDTAPENQSPSVEVNLSPVEGIYLGTSLSCGVSGEDPEDGVLSADIQWFQNNVDLSSSATELYLNPNSMSVGDEIRCTATVTDSGGLEESDAQSTLIEAKPIAIDSIDIQDPNGDGFIYNDETVHCVISVVEVEDVVGEGYEWELNGSALAVNSSSLDLSAEGAMPGDVLLCRASVINGELGGSDMATAEITIDNRPPPAPLVSISPSNPRSDEDLLCEAEQPVDLDGEAIQGMVFQWTDGNATITSETLSSNYLSDNAEWRCDVYAQDLLSNGDIGFATVTILPACTYSSSESESLDLGTGVSLTLNRIQGCDDPLGRYTLTHDYYMMTTEVTQDMFTAVLGANPVGSSTSYGYGGNYPAYYVDWHVAANFANEITALHNAAYNTTLSNCYTCSGSNPLNGLSCSYTMNPYLCDGYSLPTAAEWEYAARSGTAEDFWTGSGPDLGGSVLDLLGCGNSTADTTIAIDDGVNILPLSDYAWFCGNENDNTYTGTAKPVALKAPNGFGLYDMTGNLKEWVTDDSSQNYPNNPVNPVSMGNASNKVLMNGNWWGNASSLLLGHYVLYNGTADAQGNGFRLRRLVP